MAQVSANELVGPRYLYHFMRSDIFRSHLGKRADGVNINNLKFGDIEDLRIPLPSPSEQERIVAILDDAFEGIAKATANAERNLANARDLFQTSLEQRFAHIRSVAPKMSVDAVGRVQTGNTPPSSMAGMYGDYVPFIKPADFAPTGDLNYDNDGLSEDGAAVARSISAGSALMVCIGATIGKTGYTERDIATNQQINSITPRNGVSGRFLYYQMRTTDFQLAVLKSASQATLPIINKSKWSALPIWLPEGALQQKICAEMDSLLEYTSMLAKLHQRKIEGLLELRSTILARAFSGDLDAKIPIPA